MNNVTIVWSVVLACALLLAIVHCIVWLFDRSARASLAFAFMSLGLVGISWAELEMMNAVTAHEWNLWVRWFHPANFSLIVGALAFVTIYLGTGRTWLLWTVIAIRSFILVANFAVFPNFTFERVDSLVKMSFLGEQVSVISGAVPREWQWIASLAQLLLVAYLVDASVTLWRRGTADARRKAILVGGAIAVFFILASLYTQLVIWGVFRLPMLVAPPFAVVLAVMAYEMSREMLRAARIARELSESEQQLELAAHAAGLGLWSWDARTDRIWATARARAMSYVANGNPDLEQLAAMISGEDIAAVRKALRQVDSSDSGQEVTFRIRTPDGSVRWLQARGRPERNRRGELVLIRGVVRDVTDAHQAQEELDELRRDLAHAGRVTVLGQLAGALAHELSQPLGAILRNAEAAELLLQQPNPDTRELREIVTDIRRDDNRATQVIDKLRALLKRRQMEFQPIPVDNLLQDVTLLVRADASARKLTLDSAIEPGLGMVSGDRVHLSQVLINLIVNAMDAVAGLPPERRKIVIRAQHADDNVIQIAVCDCGAGISEETVTKLFKPFFTTKAAGMGMGLYVSKTIIEAHHGKLAAINNPAGGATFQFSLPACNVAHA